MPPFGSPKREGRPERARRNTRGVERSQVHPPQGGTRARVHRHRRLWDRSPHRPPSDRPLRLGEVRLNGFPEPLAAVHRDRIGGDGRRVSDPSPTGSLGAANAGEPAYPQYNRGAGEGRCPFDPRQTRAPVDCAGGGVAPPFPPWRRGPLVRSRPILVAVRLTPDESADWRTKAKAAGVPLSVLIRRAMARTRTWTVPAANVERNRQVSRIGNNLNQIARWANTHKGAVEAVEVIGHLIAIKRALAALSPLEDPDADAG